MARRATGSIRTSRCVHHGFAAVALNPIPMRPGCVGALAFHLKDLVNEVERCGLPAPSPMEVDGCWRPDFGGGKRDLTRGRFWSIGGDPAPGGSTREMGV